MLIVVPSVIVVINCITMQENDQLESISYQVTRRGRLQCSDILNNQFYGGLPHLFKTREAFTTPFPCNTFEALMATPVISIPKTFLPLPI